MHILFSDNEPSLLKAEFQAYLVHKGIQHFTTQAYSSEMNGPAENAIKHLVQRASAMMHIAKIPEGFWPEAVRVSTYWKNRSPHTAITMTPYKAWFDQQPDLGHLRIFGCCWYAHVEKKNRTKWESHTAEGILMGYYAHEGLYAIYDVNKRVVVKKRDVTFFKNIIGHLSMDGFSLAPGYNILGEPIDNCDTTDELLIGDLKPSAEDILAITTANFHESTYSTEEYIYVPVDTMVSTVSMSFIHHALKEWQQERKRQRRDEVVDSELKVEELVKRYELRYEDLRIEYGITAEVDVM